MKKPARGAPNNPQNSRSEWEFYLGLALENINAEMTKKGMTSWTAKRLAARLKGMNAATLRKLHFECERAERGGTPYGKVFFAKTKKTSQ
ncbi:hypothetical protein L0Y40_01565 [Candidatus Wolfebacteria bacterium]|nr:hypothetical protein [Candidatus Wolfebacteria bacterium]